jgi:hypothetical protein
MNPNLLYPQSYHQAQHLVAFGGHNGDTQHGRNLCAQALNDLRKSRGHVEALFIKRSLEYISGCLPVKSV